MKFSIKPELKKGIKSKIEITPVNSKYFTIFIWPNFFKNNGINIKGINFTDIDNAIQMADL